MELSILQIQKYVFSSISSTLFNKTQGVLLLVFDVQRSLWKCWIITITFKILSQTSGNIFYLEIFKDKLIVHMFQNWNNFRFKLSQEPDDSILPNEQVTYLI